MIYKFEFEDGRYEADVTVTPGQPERGPSYDCGGTPADPAEIEVLKVWMINEDKTKTLMADFDSIAELLLDHHNDDILEQFADDVHSSMEDAADARRDRYNEDRFDR